MCQHPCGRPRISWLMSAFERTLKLHLVCILSQKLDFTSPQSNTHTHCHTTARIDWPWQENISLLIGAVDACSHRRLNTNTTQTAQRGVDVTWLRAALNIVLIHLHSNFTGFKMTVLRNTQGDSGVISMPDSFRRHLVGKTLRNVCQCDIAQILAN